MKSHTCEACTESRRAKPEGTVLAMFVGLSAKPDTGDLCPTTNTGKLISSIEQRISGAIGVYKTNAVKYAPLDDSGKLRYPSASELNACLPCLLAEIESVAPRIIVPLGGSVSRFLLQALGVKTSFSGFESDFQYKTYSFPYGYAMPIHHPSYIWIYKRKRLDEYVERVAGQLKELVGV